MHQMVMSAVEGNNVGERKGCALAFVFNKVTAEQNLEKEQTSWTLGKNVPSRVNSNCRNSRRGRVRENQSMCVGRRYMSSERGGGGSSVADHARTLALTQSGMEASGGQCLEASYLSVWLCYRVWARAEAGVRGECLETPWWQEVGHACTLGIR